MKVLFVVMPFGWVRPSIGVSLLKGHLERAGVSSKVMYPNVSFAETLGLPFYQTIAHDSPPQSLLGDWIFSRALFEPNSPRNEDSYVTMLRSRFQTFPESKSGDLSKRLADAREAAVGFIEALFRETTWSLYDLIGFSTNFHQNIASLAIAKRIKADYPKAKIVFGGANCEGRMGLQLHAAFRFIDFVCCGEGDVAFPQLVSQLIRNNSPHGIPGIVSRQGTRSFFTTLQPQRVEDLDSLPFPAYDDYFSLTHRFVSAPNLRHVLMETSRGCWWGEKAHCTFCGLNGSSMKYRAKTARRALDELVHVTKTYKTPHVEFVDNILSMQYFTDLLPALAKLRLDLDLFYETKSNLRKEQIHILRNAGVRTIQPGIESFSRNVLRLMRKGVTPLQNVRLLKWCKESGIKCNWNLIYGFPGETDADYAEILQVIGQLHHLDPPTGCGPIRLDRFSPYFERPEAFQFRNLRPDRAYHYAYRLPESSLSEIAYYFEYDYDAPNCILERAVELQKASEQWIRNAKTSGLVYVDDGEELTIQDFRTGSPHYTTALREVERILYLYCDTPRAYASVTQEASKHGWTASQVGALFQRLIERRLVLCVESEYLAIAVGVSPSSARRHDQSQPAAVELNDSERNCLRKKLEHWDEGLSSRERAFVRALFHEDFLSPPQPNRSDANSSLR